MTLNSMTGFARTEGANEACSWVLEAKSVNAKGIDTRLKLPIGFETLDRTIRERVKKRFRRGNIFISLNVNWVSSKATYRLNMENLKHLIAEVPVVQKLAPGLAPITMDGLLAAKGVIENIEGSLDNEEQHSLNSEILISLDGLLERLQVARCREGEELKSLLNAQIKTIEDLCREAGDLAALKPERIKKNLRKQVAELCGAIPELTEERLSQEVAILMLKADIREELDRIIVHTNSVRRLMVSGETIGREFDFICQELNREANTLCSKSTDVALTQVGLNLRTVIDQLREQVQNVE